MSIRSFTTSRVGLVAASIAVFFLALSCGPVEPTTPGEARDAGQEVVYPLTVTDDSGTSVTLPRRPVAIVSLTLMSDEMLLGLLEPSRIKALSTLSDDVNYSNVVEAAKAVKDRVGLSVEGVLALQPDLAIVASWSDAGKVEQLRAGGVPVYLVASPLTFDDVKRQISALGTLTDSQAKARELVASVDARLAAVADKVATVPAAQQPNIVDYSSWGSASGVGSSWDSMVYAAGLVNAVGALTADDYGQVALSKEVLVELNPEVLVLPGFIFGEAGAAEAFKAQVLGDPALGGMKAIKNGRVIVMPEGLKSSVSQYMVDGVEFLAKAVYPDLFK